MKRNFGILILVFSFVCQFALADSKYIYLKDAISKSENVAVNKKADLVEVINDDMDNLASFKVVQNKHKKSEKNGNMSISVNIDKKNESPDKSSEVSAKKQNNIENTQSAVVNTVHEKKKNVSKCETVQEKPVSFGFRNPRYSENRFFHEDSIVYQENRRIINDIDPVKEGNVNANYPGQRGPNQLIIYTPKYGLRTETNEYGTEAIVENNMVVRLNGADSIIPKNGFVISGHGSAKTWILKNIQMGSKVYIDYNDNSLIVFLTPDSLVFAAKEKLKEVNGIVNYYKNSNGYYDDKKASEFLENSKDYLKKAENKPEKTQTYINAAMTSLDDAIKNAIPYSRNELKGVWLRPVETTPEEIVKTIEKINEVGITDIFLETYFHGKTIYPSKFMKKYGVIWQREEFVGFDPLEVWIREAHARNMKVHIWFECYYVGNDIPKITPNHVLQVYPLWTNKRLSNYDADEPMPSLSEHNGYFLDPANLQVHEYLLGIINEIIENYSPDGINLDYIRYPQSVETKYSNYVMSNWGYTQVARNEFRGLYRIDPINIKYGTPDWDLWTVYRQNKITKFVSDVKKLTEPKQVMLTAVMFPDLQKCKTTKMQDWRVWSTNHYVDGLTPLILTGDKNTAVSLLNDIKMNTSPLTDIYPGLFVTFMGGPYDDLLLQIHKTREYNTKGTILFDYAHLNDKYIDALKIRVFNKNYDVKDSKNKYNKDISIDSNKELKTKKEYKPEVKYKDKRKKK